MYNERPASDAVLGAQPSAILNVTPGTRSALAFVNDWLAAIEQLEAPVAGHRAHDPRATVNSQRKPINDW
jgi:hypothetical protein